MSVLVVVDRNRCASVSMCLQLAPGSFELDSEGISVFVGGSDADEWELNEAAEGCPNAAISVVVEQEA